MNRWNSISGQTSPKAWRARNALLCGAFSLSALLLAVPNPAAVGRGLGSAASVIVTPLSLVKVKDLDFGKIAPRPTAGTVLLNPVTKACTVTGGIIHAGLCQPAEFAGMGAGRFIVRVQLPNSVVLSRPGATMTLNRFRMSAAPDLVRISGSATNGRYQIQPASGIFSFFVGGTLRVKANQAPGQYTATFPVTVQYQ